MPFYWLHNLEVVILQPEKQRNFFDLPITKGFNFSVPVEVTQSRIVSCSLRCFFPWDFSFLSVNDFSGSDFKNRPVNNSKQ